MESRQPLDTEKAPVDSSFARDDWGDLIDPRSTEERANVHSTGFKRLWTVHAFL